MDLLRTTRKAYQYRNFEHEMRSAYHISCTTSRCGRRRLLAVLAIRAVNLDFGYIGFARCPSRSNNPRFASTRRHISVSAPNNCAVSTSLDQPSFQRQILRQNDILLLFVRSVLANKVLDSLFGNMRIGRCALDGEVSDYTSQR